MKSIFSLFLFSLSLSYTFAQHCPFDNAGLLVVKIIDAKTKKTIKNLQPYLKIEADSYDRKEAEHLKSINPFSKGDSLFVMNPKRTNKNWTDGYQIEKISFTFAQSCFIQHVSMDLKEYNNISIGVLDKNGVDLGVEYSVKPEDFFDLHGNFGHNWFEISELKSTPAPSQPFNKLIVIEIERD